MYTSILFIDNGGPFTCGFRLNSKNWFYAPHGRIRLARFDSLFSPKYGHGYYGDIYLRKFIRIWKNKVIISKRRKIEKKMAILCTSKKQILNYDVIRHIVGFL